MLFIKERFLLYPLHIHGFFLRVLTDRTYSRIYHGSLRFGHFTTDLRVVTSYYELFTVCYGLLRVTTIYLRQNSTICYELSRITTGNLRVSNDLLTCCYEYLRVSYEYLRVLTIFNQNITTENEMLNLQLLYLFPKT